MSRRTVRSVRIILAACAWLAGASIALAVETCMSAYMPKVTGQEDYVYVITLGMEGVGDGQDKLVTVGANPAKPSYGKVISSTSLGGQHEVHHGGFTDDRRYFWVGGVADSGGVAGPHTFFALPGRMLISGLSNTKDNGGKTGMVEYNNDGQYVQT